MADFYAQCIAIVELGQWAQAVDSKFGGLEALVGLHPASDNVPAWRSDESFDRQAASGLLPGLSQVAGGRALALVATRFPAVPARPVPVSLCGTVISEPGQYVLAPGGNAAPQEGPNCLLTGLGRAIGADVAAPGVSLDLDGRSTHALLGLSGSGFAPDAVVLFGPAASGGLVDNGTVAAPGGAGTAILDLASGLLATHLVVKNFGEAFAAARVSYSRFVYNLVPDWAGGGGEGAVWSREVPGVKAFSAGVTLAYTKGVTVAHNDFRARYIGSDGAVVLLGSSGDLVEDNTIVAYGNGVYAGCNGYISRPPAHPLAEATCAASTGNEIAGNDITVLPGTGSSGLPAAGPAIALGSSTARNVVSANHVTFAASHTFALWDYNACGVNTWRGNAVKFSFGAYQDHLSNWPCVH
jgi:hypothetical protein